MATILIIDDEAGIRTLIRSILEPEHKVVEAADGVEGMERFREDRFDLVIIDLIMPDQEGLETIMQIRARIPEQMIIAISGGGSTKTTEFLRLAGHIGANRILKKPFELNVLRDSIRACLSPR
jgi:DNA-binding response OmpR family regulator